LYSPSLSSTTRLTGKSNHGIAEALVVTEAAVETHVTAIFHKLELGRAPTEHRRVLAVLTYLRGRPAPSDAHEAGSRRSRNARPGRAPAKGATRPQGFPEVPGGAGRRA
jgi:hypothetical protein